MIAIASTRKSARKRCVAEREVRLLRAVAGRREAVGAEPDPGEERDQRDLVEDRRRERVLAVAEDDASEAGAGLQRRFTVGGDSTCPSSLEPERRTVPTPERNANAGTRAEGSR